MPINNGRNSQQKSSEDNIYGLPAQTLAKLLDFITYIYLLGKVRPFKWYAKLGLIFRQKRQWQRRGAPRHNGFNHSQKV
jgi:hypothetical protein